MPARTSVTPGTVAAGNAVGVEAGQHIHRHDQFKVRGWRLHERVGRGVEARAPRGELSLVLADELAPVVKVYAWQVILGRNGILNWLIPGPPKSWLLFSSFAVIVTDYWGSTDFTGTDLETIIQGRVNGVYGNAPNSSARAPGNTVGYIID